MCDKFFAERGDVCAINLSQKEVIVARYLHRSTRWCLCDKSIAVFRLEHSKMSQQILDRFGMIAICCYNDWACVILAIRFLNVNRVYECSDYQVTIKTRTFNSSYILMRLDTHGIKFLLSMRFLIFNWSEIQIDPFMLWIYVP